MSCQTEFALDDRQVGPEGASVRCSLCGHVFRATAPDGVVAQPWQVRTIDDLLFTAPDLATLLSWVLEGRLHPDDSVSRSGRHFVKLGEMPEFAEAFAGFVGLPGVLETEAERGKSEQSALDVLGPPPAFGTHAGDEDAAALAGVPEQAGVEHSSMLDRVADQSSGLLPIGVPVEAPVARSRQLGGAMPSADASAVPRPVPPRQSTPVPASRPPTRPPTTPPSRTSTVVDAGRGVPGPVVDDRSSSRPMSMLDVVTQHVRPIAAPAVESPRFADSAPVAAAREAAREVVAARIAREPDDVVERRRSSWPLWAALGVLTGGALVFGIPQIRARVLGTTPEPAVVATDNTKVFDDANAALASADPQALARADAALHAAIDAGAGADGERLRVTAAEVLATRAVVHEMWAAVEPAMRSDARFWAQEDAGRAVGLLGQLQRPDVSTAASFARAHALLRVVQGRADAAGLAVDEETALLVAVAPLLRDTSARLPEPVRAGLAGLAKPSMLARLVLALGHSRAGDLPAARTVIDAVLAESPGQPVARALGRAASGAPADKPTTPDPTAGEDPVVVADTGAGEVPTPVVAESPDKLIDRGCRKAESGDAAGAVAVLKKALEKRPNDTDALLCMGDANAKLGSHDVALKHYERALARAPQMMSALQGAGKSAAKVGRTSKAVKFYERLLEQDPSHAQARAYVDAHKADPPAEGTDNG